MGGAYIETDEPVSVGQKIIISLSPSNSERSVDVLCRIVRRIAGGIGVQFEPLRREQVIIVESLLS